MTEALTADDLRKLPRDSVILNSYDEAYQKLHTGDWWGIGHYQKSSIAAMAEDSCRLIYTPEEAK